MTLTSNVDTGITLYLPWNDHTEVAAGGTIGWRLVDRQTLRFWPWPSVTGNDDPSGDCGLEPNVTANGAPAARGPVDTYEARLESQAIHISVEYSCGPAAQPEEPVPAPEDSGWRDWLSDWWPF